VAERLEGEAGEWTETATGADLTEAERVLQTILFGPWRTTRAFLPLRRRSPHPRVVIVSSGAGSHGDRQFGVSVRDGAAASYDISKAALNALVPHDPAAATRPSRSRCRRGGPFPGG
jgi:NAD(P)-dependent dehydrogenase (short-subunit alcohol dehydrogenase family)